VVEHLPSKHEALSSNSSTAKKGKRRKNLLNKISFEVWHIKEKTKEVQFDNIIRLKYNSKLYWIMDTPIKYFNQRYYINASRICITLLLFFLSKLTTRD
jgi:hypothetical protein